MLIAETNDGIYHPTSMSWTGSVSHPECSGASDEYHQQVQQQSKLPGPLRLLPSVPHGDVFGP